MTKKAEINTNNNIIIGIAAFAIIAIAIIAFISFFTPKSHAQALENKFDKVVLSTFNGFESKSVMDDNKLEWSKNTNNARFKEQYFANTFNGFTDKEKNDNAPVMFKDHDKTSFTFASAKFKDFESFSSFARNQKDNFKVKFYSEKQFQS